MSSIGKYERVPKKIYLFRACPLLFLIMDGYAEKARLTQSALIRNAIEYAYTHDSDLRDLELAKMLWSLMDRFHITVESRDLAIASCVKPEAHIMMYEKTTIQVDESFHEMMREYARKEGLPMGEMVRRAIILYISRKIATEKNEEGRKGKT